MLMPRATPESLISDYRFCVSKVSIISNLSPNSCWIRGFVLFVNRATLAAYEAGMPGNHFGFIRRRGKEFESYIIAIQDDIKKDYSRMEQIIRAGPEVGTEISVKRERTLRGASPKGSPIITGPLLVSAQSCACYERRRREEIRR